jgi:hypothetical protein
MFLLTTPKTKKIVKTFCKTYWILKNNSLEVSCTYFCSKKNISLVPQQ